MRIQHNIAALNSHRQLTNNNSSVAKNLEKLSSGYRINRAGDDAAGLAISEKMRAQITGLNTASKNAQDGISLVQTAEGALTEVHSMLNRMTELAGQAANGTYQNEVDRENAMKELTSLRSEIDRISEGTNFNGIKLLDGTMGTGSTGVSAASLAAATGTTAGLIKNAVNFSVSGLEAGKTISIKTGTNASGISADASGNITINLKSAAGAKYTQADIDKLIRDATLPSSASGLKVTVDKDLEITTVGTADVALVTNATSAKAKNAYITNTTDEISVTSKVAGKGMDGKTLTFDNTGTQGVTVDQAGNVTIGLEAGKSYTSSELNSMLSGAGANMTIDFKGSKTDAVLKGSGAGAAGNLTTGVFTLGGGAGLSSGGGLSLQIGDTAEGFNQLNVAVASMSTVSLGLSGINIGTQDGAKDAVDVIKKAINTVSSTRGDLGAIQNRLEHTINNLGVTAENMTAAESRIRDVDMAQEMMTFTKNNILTQASQAMLAQANQLPQGVLQLLQ